MRQLLVCFALAACTTNNGPMSSGDDDGDDAAPDAGTSTTSVTPVAGLWYYAESSAVHSSCSQPVQGEAGEFGIDMVTKSAFRIVPNDGTLPFSCTLAGAEFDCPDRAWDSEELANLDATLIVHGTAEGTFSSSTRATGQQHATVTCTGSDCGSLGLPCTFDVNFVIRAR
ncbi:MAG TPA: hypothetical protein VMZ53_30475 [Kofleriaceae bacterium]|nr:hypothetical protein [Kofleriaceae bacterium]